MPSGKISRRRRRSWVTGHPSPHHAPGPGPGSFDIHRGIKRAYVGTLAGELGLIEAASHTAETARRRLGRR